MPSFWDSMTQGVAQGSKLGSAGVDRILDREDKVLDREQDREDKKNDRTAMAQMTIDAENRRIKNDADQKTKEATVELQSQSIARKMIEQKITDPEKLFPEGYVKTEIEQQALPKAIEYHKQFVEVADKTRLKGITELGMIMKSLGETKKYATPEQWKEVSTSFNESDIAKQYHIDANNIVSDEKATSTKDMLFKTPFKLPNGSVIPAGIPVTVIQDPISHMPVGYFAAESTTSETARKTAGLKVPVDPKTTVKQRPDGGFDWFNERTKESGTTHTPESAKIVADAQAAAEAEEKGDGVFSLTPGKDWQKARSLVIQKELLSSSKAIPTAEGFYTPNTNGQTTTVKAALAGLKQAEQAGTLLPEDIAAIRDKLNKFPLDTVISVNDYNPAKKVDAAQVDKDANKEGKKDKPTLSDRPAAVLDVPKQPLANPLEPKISDEQRQKNKDARSGSNKPTPSKSMEKPKETPYVGDPKNTVVKAVTSLSDARRYSNATRIATKLAVGAKVSEEDRAFYQKAVDDGIIKAIITR